MKISQNESTNNNSTTTSATTTTISKEIQHQQQQQYQHPQNTSQFPSQQHQQHTVEKRKAKTLKNKILQNVAQQQRQEEQQQQQQQLQRDEQNARGQNDKSHDTPSSAMTDERSKSNNNNENSGNNNNTRVTENKSTTTKIATSKTLVKDIERKDTVGGNNSSDLIIAEAAKILLKNGLNGTNAAAAAAVATATATLLTAAANFHQLPPVAHNLSAGNCDLTTTTTSISSSLSSLSHSPSRRSSSSAPDCQGLETNVTTAAAAAHAQLVAIAAAAAAVNATNHKRLATSVPCSSSPSSLVATKTFSSSSSTSACKSPNQNINNGLLDNSVIQTTTKTTTISTKSTQSTAVADATTPTAHFTKPYKANCCKTTMPSDSAVDMGIIDYTVNSQSSSTTATTSFSSSSSSSIINLSTSGNSSHYSNSASHNKFLANNNKGVVSSHANRSDIGRPPITHQTSSSVNTQKNTLSGVGSGGNSLGGRLQFFKDGKFILELARSKDGEKGGWVSVPRKLFRTPSAATSSTVTPSATASTAAAAIPSPLAASPAAVVGGGTSSYPKNECSNSLSFSDDNSSLQSSPWQRDHCWKQATPRKNVSKEMTLFYRRPACRKLAVQAILLSHRKRRKPYDTTTLDNGLMYELNANKRKYQQHFYDTSTLDNGIMFGVNANRQEQQQKKHRENKCLLNKKELETKEEVDNVTIEGAENELKGEDVKGNKSNTTEDEEQKIHEAENKDNVVKSEEQEEKKKECDKSCDQKNIKTEDCLKTDSDDIDMDVDMIKISSPCKAEEKSLESAKPLEDTKTKMKDEVVKMSTRDCADEKEPSKRSISLNGNISKEEKHGNAAKSQVDRMKTGDEEQRLKKYENCKTRAKLNTIVQKLLDASTSRVAETAHSFRTSNQTTSSSTTTTSTVSSSSVIVGSSTGGSKHHNSKVSPPSNTAASRLVEYHQQHVSPRKRILREFEKVSLEDNSTAAAGGKRSRAKNNNISSSSAASNSNATTSSSGTSHKTMNFNAHNSNLGNIPKSNATSATSNAPTKLYSSYSIHSLLGGGVSSPPSSSPSTALSPTSKRSTDLPATITSNTMAIFSQYHSTPFSSSSHSNNSPKSPEGGSSMGGGKSPSNSVTKSKRSPPYRSPMRETQSRSPISSGIVGFNDYGGRKSPRSIPDTAHNAFNKMRYAGSGGTDSTPSPSNHHLNHHQQHHLHSQQNYHHQPQTYYSPYMMSPHYVPPLSGPSALSPNASSVNTQSSSTSTSSRSPRHHASAFRATTPTSASLTSTTHNIPSTQRGDLSPQRSTTSSPRETTPRTVPKKTASIRRQFASPTSATQNHSSSNCSSPTTTLESRSEDQLNNDRRTPVSANASHEQHQQPQHLMQRGLPSNSNIAGSPIHPYSYMYAHPSSSGSSPHTSNSAGSNLPSPSTANASAAAAVAAAAASYIPAVVGSPYYHPYISTLAAMRHPQMWMQHYQSAAAAATNPALLQVRHPAMLSAAAAAGAAARLSPPYHGFQYNGVGNAAALAAAAAAASFGSTSNPSHLSSNPLSHPGSMFNPMTNSNLHGMQHSATALHAAGLVPASAAAVALASATPLTDTTTDLSKSSKNNFACNTSSPSTSGNGGATHSSLSSARSSENSMYTISNKDEQSSDVPLNLSKH